MARGDKTAPLAGLAAALGDVKGELKDIQSRMKAIKKEGEGITATARVELERLTQRREVLTQKLRSDSDLKRVEREVKFLKAIAVGRSITALASGGLNRETIGRLATDPNFIDGLGKSLEKLSKFRSLQGTATSAALGLVGRSLGRVAFPVGVATELLLAYHQSQMENIQRETRTTDLQSGAIDAARAGRIDPDTFNLIQSKQRLKGLVVEGKEERAQAVAEAVKEEAKRIAQDRGFLERLSTSELDAVAPGVLTGEETPAERRRKLNLFAYANATEVNRAKSLAEGEQEKERIRRENLSPAMQLAEEEKFTRDRIAFSIRRPVRVPSYAPVGYED